MAAKRLRRVHPGDVLLYDFIQPLKLSYRVAKELGVIAGAVNGIVRRRRAITAEMTLRLSRYFGTSAQLWQNLQTQRLDRSSYGRDELLGRIPPILDNLFPRVFLRYASQAADVARDNCAVLRTSGPVECTQSSCTDRVHIQLDADG